MIKFISLICILVNISSCSTIPKSKQTNFDIFKNNFSTLTSMSDVELLYGKPSIIAADDVSVYYLYFEGQMTRKTFGFDISSKKLASAHWFIKSEDIEHNIEYMHTLYGKDGWKRMDREWIGHAGPGDFFLENHEKRVSLNIRKSTPSLVESISFQKENVTLPKASRRLAVVSENK